MQNTLVWERAMEKFSLTHLLLSRNWHWIYVSDFRVREWKVFEWARKTKLLVSNMNHPIGFSTVFAPFLHSFLLIVVVNQQYRKSFNYFFFIYFPFHSLDFKLANAVDFPPIIMPSESDVTVLPSENVNFTCQSTEPVHWRFFVSAVYVTIDSIFVWRFFFLFCRIIHWITLLLFIFFKQDGFESKYDIHESYNQNNEYPYQSILELPAVDYLNVGYYYCVKNATVDEHLDTLVDTGQASHIYLFVEGKFSRSLRIWIENSNRLIFLSDSLQILSIQLWR